MNFKIKARFIEHDILCYDYYDTKMGLDRSNLNMCRVVDLYRANSFKSNRSHFHWVSSCSTYLHTTGSNWWNDTLFLSLSRWKKKYPCAYSSLNQNELVSYHSKGNPRPCCLVAQPINTIHPTIVKKMLHFQ